MGGTTMALHTQVWFVYYRFICCICLWCSCPFFSFLFSRFRKNGSGRYWNTPECTHHTHWRKGKCFWHLYKCIPVFTTYSAYQSSSSIESNLEILSEVLEKEFPILKEKILTTLGAWSVNPWKKIGNFGTNFLMNSGQCHWFAPQNMHLLDTGGAHECPELRIRKGMFPIKLYVSRWKNIIFIFAIYFCVLMELGG